MQRSVLRLSTWSNVICDWSMLHELVCRCRQVINAGKDLKTTHSHYRFYLAMTSHPGHEPWLKLFHWKYFSRQLFICVSDNNNGCSSMLNHNHYGQFSRQLISCKGHKLIYNHYGHFTRQHSSWVMNCGLNTNITGIGLGGLSAGVFGGGGGGGFFCCCCCLWVSLLFVCFWLLFFFFWGGGGWLRFRHNHC